MKVLELTLKCKDGFHHAVTLATEETKLLIEAELRDAPTEIAIIDILRNLCDEKSAVTRTLSILLEMEERLIEFNEPLPGWSEDSEGCTFPYLFWWQRDLIQSKERAKRLLNPKWRRK